MRGKQDGNEEQTTHFPSPQGLSLLRRRRTEDRLQGFKNTPLFRDGTRENRTAKDFGQLRQAPACAHTGGEKSKADRPVALHDHSHGLAGGAGRSILPDRSP